MFILLFSDYKVTYKYSEKEIFFLKNTLFNFKNQQTGITYSKTQTNKTQKVCTKSLKYKKIYLPLHPRLNKRMFNLFY